MKHAQLFNEKKGGLIQKTVMMLVVMLCMSLSVTNLQAQNVATLDGTGYTTLQAALTAAQSMTGDKTITLIANTTEEVNFRQQTNLNLTINGGGKTLTGKIVIHGDTRYEGTDELIITNLNFEYSPTSDPKGFVCVNGTNNNAHNITVSNCTFDGGGPANGMAAYRGPNGAPAFNVVLDHLVVKNAHSLAMVYGTTGLTITNCKAVDNIKNGINISGGKGTYTIENDTLTCNTDGEYAFRFQNQSNATTANLSGNVFTGPKAIITKANSNTAAALNVSSGLYEGILSSEGTDNTVFGFTGGTFTETYTTVQNYCATNYFAYDEDPAPGYCTIRKNIPILRMDSTDVICYDDNNGTDTVRIQGGTPPFQLVLSSSVLAKNDTVNLTGRLHIYTDLKPGSYLVSLTDNEGETASGTFTIKRPDSPLEITALSVPQRPCPLMGSGSYDVSVTAQGGHTGAYTYTWSGAVQNNASTTTVASGIDDRDSTYTVSVTVTDSKNCSVTTTGNFTVSAVIANDGTVHSNSKLTIDTIRQGIMTGCDTIIRDFGTPVFTTTIPEGYPENRLIIVNNIPAQYPDSVFALGESKIIWTATDTCGHSITGVQVIIIYHYPCPDMTDQDGNVYSSVRIACDCWTTENLKTTTDNNGNTISNLMSYQSPMHPDAAANAATYGYLYDWNTALDADGGVTVDAEGNVQGICPTGWHLPTQDNYMSITGGISSTDMTDLRYNNYWLDGGGNNSTGFSLLPGGLYNDNTGRYENLLEEAYLWSVNTVNVNEPKVFWADCHCYMWRVYDATTNTGCSVRCIKD